MTSSLITILVIILSMILIDVFCSDISDSRQRQAWQNTGNVQKNPDILPNTQSSTPWPALGKRYTTNRSLNEHTTKPSTEAPRKWIQQNNIWIKNEQGYTGGNEGIQLPQNSQNNKGVGQRADQHHRLAGNVPTSAKPPLNRGDTYIVLKPQIIKDNRQQALIDGLGGNSQNLMPSSTTQSPNKPGSNIRSRLPTKKPISFADVVGSKSTTLPTPSSSKVPSAPQTNDPKKDSLPSAGPVHDIDDFDVKDRESTDNKGTSDSDVTDDELREFSENLLRKDTNNAMKYVTLNVQGKTSSRTSNDEAPLPLMKIDDAAYNIPSIEKIKLLYNNYFLDAGQNEVYTGQERIEENNLLDAILSTPLMQFARSFLVQKGKIGKDPKEFRDLLRLIWFNMYSRGNGRIGSSGFEHVFVAEIKNNQVSGLHNWIYFNDEESQNRANYLGYLKKIDLGDKGVILKYHFTFHDIDKPVGSMFIGTSPELEMALYSTCFILRADRICPLKMNGNRFIIRTYTFRYRGKNMIGSAFPEI